MKLLYKNWSETTLEFYLEFLDINFRTWESDIEHMTEIIALFADCAPDDEEFDNMTLDEFKTLWQELAWTRREYRPSVANYEDLVPVAHKTLTLGAWIDCDHYLKEGHSYWPECLAILLRTPKAPYDYDPTERREAMLKIPTNQALATLYNFLDWKQSFIKENAGLFQDPDWDKVENEEELPPEELVRIRQEIAHDKRKAPFSWLGLVWELSGHDITKFSGVFNTPVILVFNVLAMRKALKI